MKKIDILFVGFALLLGFLCYFSTNSFIYAPLAAIILIADYFVLMRKKFLNYSSLIERVHTSYHFINSFVISLSVKNSLDDAYESAIQINNATLNAETNELNAMSVIDRIKYLRDYFRLAIYKMFLNVVDLHQDQGGNILNIADNLMRECTRVEKTLSDTISIGNKHIKEFLILWLMTFAILIFMRVSIKDFYLQMLKNPLISPLIFLFFLICIVSINLFVISFTDLSIKEDSLNEKN